MAAELRIGVAGWSLPRAVLDEFPREGSHLARYAARLNCAEINSSFYRPHQPATYARWAASVPANFRFAVKLPRAITHDARLRGVGTDLDRASPWSRRQARLPADPAAAELRLRCRRGGALRCAAAAALCRCGGDRAAACHVVRVRSGCAARAPRAGARSRRSCDGAYRSRTGWRHTRLRLFPASWFAAHVLFGLLRCIPARARAANLRYEHRYAVLVRVRQHRTRRRDPERPAPANPPAPALNSD